MHCSSSRRARRPDYQCPTRPTGDSSDRSRPSCVPGPTQTPPRQHDHPISRPRCARIRVLTIIPSLRGALFPPGPQTRLPMSHASDWRLVGSLPPGQCARTIPSTTPLREHPISRPRCALIRVLKLEIPSIRSAVTGWLTVAPCSPLQSCQAGLSAFYCFAATIQACPASLLVGTAKC